MKVPNGAGQVDGLGSDVIGCSDHRSFFDAATSHHDSHGVGIVAAAKDVNLSVPLVVRLEGTNVQQGKDILANSGLPIVAANDLGDAAKKIVAEVRKVA